MELAWHILAGHSGFAHLLLAKRTQETLANGEKWNSVKDLTTDSHYIQSKPQVRLFLCQAKKWAERNSLWWRKLKAGYKLPVRMEVMCHIKGLNIKWNCGRLPVMNWDKVMMMKICSLLRSALNILKCYELRICYKSSSFKLKAMCVISDCKACLCPDMDVEEKVWLFVYFRGEKITQSLRG